MSYVTYNKSMYRTGLRPIGETDPFAASQLSGLGRTPFDPEILLGQTHPFTRAGGYGLHGLGDIVPNGSIVQYTGTWATDISTTPGAVLAQVVSALRSDGFNVLASSESGGLMGELFTGSFTATIQLQVSNGMGFSQPADIAAIVDHEAYVASGVMPSGSGASVVSLPGSTPGALPPGALPAGATDWSAWFQQNASWIGLGILGIFIVPKVLERF
jgi:hypothetical protein